MPRWTDDNTSGDWGSLSNNNPDTEKLLDSIPDPTELEKRLVGEHDGTKQYTTRLKNIYSGARANNLSVK